MGSDHNAFGLFNPLTTPSPGFCQAKARVKNTIDRHQRTTGLHTVVQTNTSYFIITSSEHQQWEEDPTYQ